jgi:hypothetical protein
MAESIDVLLQPVLAHHQLPQELALRALADTDLLAILINLANFTAKNVPELKKPAFAAKSELVRLAQGLSVPGLVWSTKDACLYWPTRYGQFAFHGVSNRNIPVDDAVVWEGVKLQPIALEIVARYLKAPPVNTLDARRLV